MNKKYIGEYKPKYRCKRCKVRCAYAYGIGEFCPKCGNDFNLEEDKK